MKMKASEFSKLGRERMKALLKTRPGVTANNPHALSIEDIGNMSLKISEDILKENGISIKDILFEGPSGPKSCKCSECLAWKKEKL